MKSEDLILEFVRVQDAICTVPFKIVSVDPWLDISRVDLGGSSIIGRRSSVGNPADTRWLQSKRIRNVRGFRETDSALILANQFQFKILHI
jgi:hypothetical protein